MYIKNNSVKLGAHYIIRYAYVSVSMHVYVCMYIYAYVCMHVCIVRSVYMPVIESL